VSEMLKALRFYKEEFSDNTFTLFRWAETNTNLLLQRWDTGANAWIHAPYFIEVLGIGGSVDYDMISQEEAVEILTPTLGKKAASKAVLIGI